MNNRINCGRVLQLIACCMAFVGHDVTARSDSSCESTSGQKHERAKGLRIIRTRNRIDTIRPNIIDFYDLRERMPRSVHDRLLAAQSSGERERDRHAASLHRAGLGAPECLGRTSFMPRNSSLNRKDVLPGAPLLPRRHALERIPIRQSHIRRCGSNLDIRWEGSHRGRCRCLPKGHRRFGEPFYAACF